MTTTTTTTRGRPMRGRARAVMRDGDDERAASAVGTSTSDAREERTTRGVIRGGRREPRG